ncbi:hypothetical protein [Holospora curviuscula]|uniref:Uncharacterized protein n=1 Tax=Holospora curviuscula TaxID=1082868 RepID=A0A2S5R8R2_9PROT|nr:hypothetical protein [Holospora curviuscula]PPE03572.1 hypothetical protein HCUR_00999 [Holospora curviuscula]
MKLLITHAILYSLLLTSESYAKRLVTDKSVERAIQLQVPPLIQQQLPGVVDAQLPEEVTAQLPGVVDEKLPDVVDEKLPDVVDEKLPTAVKKEFDDNFYPKVTSDIDTKANELKTVMDDKDTAKANELKTVMDDKDTAKANELFNKIVTRLKDHDIDISDPAVSQPVQSAFQDEL